jgi:uncharacterized protein HemX
MDLTAAGASFVSVLVGIGGGIAWWERRSARKAKAEAEAAQANASRSVADAEHTLYKLLAERQSQLEAEVKTMRQELATERQHSRQLEVHIFRLENLMRTAGMDPPAREFVVG